MQITKLFFIIITGAAMLGGCATPPPLSDAARLDRIRGMEAKYCVRKCGDPGGDYLARECYNKCIKDCGNRSPDCEFHN